MSLTLLMLPMHAGTFPVSRFLLMWSSWRRRMRQSTVGKGPERRFSFMDSCERSPRRARLGGSVPLIQLESSRLQPGVHRGYTKR